MLLPAELKYQPLNAGHRGPDATGSVRMAVSKKSVSEGLFVYSIKTKTNSCITSLPYVTGWNLCLNLRAHACIVRAKTDF